MSLFLPVARPVARPAAIKSCKSRAVYLLALGSLTASATAQTSPALTTFTVPKLPFSVGVPKGWLGFDPGDGALGINMISGKVAPATTIRLLYAARPGTLDLNKQFNDVEAGLKASGATFRKQSSYAATYGGLRGLEREYAISQGSKSGMMRVWFAQDAKNLYSFQLTDNKTRYPAASTLFTRMMGTLKFKS